MTTVCPSVACSRPGRQAVPSGGSTDAPSSRRTPHETHLSYRPRRFFSAVPPSSPVHCRPRRRSTFTSNVIYGPWAVGRRMHVSCFSLNSTRRFISRAKRTAVPSPQRVRARWTGNRGSGRQETINNDQAASDASKRTAIRYFGSSSSGLGGSQRSTTPRQATSRESSNPTLTAVPDSIGRDERPANPPSP